MDYFTALQVGMNLDEVQPLVLGIVLRYAVIESQARSQLQELNWSELVHQAPTRLLTVGDRPVRIQKLIGEFQVAAAGDEPIGLEQGRKHLSLPVGDTVVVDQFGLSEP